MDSACTAEKAVVEMEIALRSDASETSELLCTQSCSAFIVRLFASRLQQSLCPCSIVVPTWRIEVSGTFSVLRSSSLMLETLRELLTIKKQSHPVE